MTHDELLVKLMVMNADESEQARLSKTTQALRAVVELHKPSKIPNWVPTNHKFICDGCTRIYPCPTIQAIEQELR
jgi:hypothetical protein